MVPGSCTQSSVMCGVPALKQGHTPVGQYVSRRQAPPGTLKRVSHTATPAALNMVLFLATKAAQALRRAPATRPSSTWSTWHSTAPQQAG
jgi:hypothetical protein